MMGMLSIGISIVPCLKHADHNNGICTRVQLAPSDHSSLLIPHAMRHAMPAVERDNRFNVTTHFRECCKLSAPSDAIQRAGPISSTTRPESMQESSTSSTEYKTSCCSLFSLAVPLPRGNPTTRTGSRSTCKWSTMIMSLNLTSSSNVHDRSGLPSRDYKTNDVPLGYEKQKPLCD